MTSIPAPFPKLFPLPLRPLRRLWACLLAPIALSAFAGEADLFPFYLPADAPTEGVTSLAFLNDQPAEQPVTVRDGHFAAGGTRIRFWGAILIGADCFPGQAEAPGLARRLASRGFNLARMHLFDGYYAPQGIFDPAHPGELRIHPEQLDRFDFLVAELKKAGLYVELPVHGWHWRNIQASAQVPGVDLQKLAPFSSGVPLWNESFVAGEKRFAREFLGHRNPYTGATYAEEPAVAALEIINENGILCAWRGGYMRKAWPEALVRDLQGSWTGFLRERYGSSDRLRQAWSQGEVRAGGIGLLRNGNFSAGLDSWNMQIAKPSAAEVSVLPSSGPEGKPCLVLESDRAAAELAFVDLYQTGLRIEKGVRYQLSFTARADGPAQLHAIVSLNRPPWNGLGLSRFVTLSGAWQKVTMNFEGSQDEAAAKLMLLAPPGKSRLFLADFSLRQAGISGLPSGQTLEAGNVRMPLAPEESLEHTQAASADFVQFLCALDQRYFSDMYEFLKHTLGCRAPVKGTQVNQYSSYFTQAACDFVDSHGYYQHPHFPRKPWDPKDWVIGNSPMVNRGGETVVELAERRVRGKPYLVSEYCHPAPSTYCAEQMPTVAAFAALQDWDGVIFHSWHELGYDWKKRAIVPLAPSRIDSFFNIARHPVKLVTLPFASLAFRRGDVAPARLESAIGLRRAEEEDWLLSQPRRQDGWSGFEVARSKGATWRDAFTHRLSLQLESSALPPMLPPDSTRAVSDTGEITYDLGAPAGGILLVNAPRAKAVIGFGAGKTFSLGQLTLQPGPTRQAGFSVITASAVRGTDFCSPGASILVTATGYVENQGMVWNAARTSVGDQWGEGPARCEGIPFALSLAARQASAWTLDTRGRRTAAVPHEPGPGGLRFQFGPQYQTLWYEISIP